MKIHESAENYIETIYMLGRRQSGVRSIDIATELEFSKPSVSIAMKNLRENGYIEVDSAGYISLTDTGLEIAERMYARHTLLTRFLTGIGVSPEVAEEDACRIEHIISAESIEAIKKYLDEKGGLS